MKSTRRVKTRREITPLQFLALVSAIAFFLFACCTFSAAWLSKNRKVEKNDMSMRLTTTLLDGFKHTDDGFVLLTDDDNSLLTEDMIGNFIPGSTTEFDVGLRNSSNHAVTVNSIGFEKPSVWGTTSGAYDKASVSVDENPVCVKEDGTAKYYYLGTEVTVKIDKYTVYSTSSVSGSAVTASGGTETACTNAAQPLLKDTLKGETLTLLNSLGKDGNGLVLESGQAVVFHVVLTFVDDDDQSALMDFGSEEVGGRLTRKIYISASD